MDGFKLIDTVKKLRAGEEKVWYHGLCFSPDLDPIDDCSEICIFKTKKGFYIGLCHFKRIPGCFQAEQILEEFKCPSKRRIISFNNVIGRLVNVDARHENLRECIVDYVALAEKLRAYYERKTLMQQGEI